MPVTKDQVLATARLCRLDLAVSSAHAREEDPERRINRIAAQMEAIVGYMDILDQVDTDKVEPLYSPLKKPQAPREDAAHKRLTAEEVLANAPERKQNFFVVPPVI